METLDKSKRQPGILPDVHYHPGLADRILEAAALLIIIANWVYIFYMRNTADAETFTTTCILGGCATFCFIITALCAYAPVRLINFPVRPTADNIAAQYAMAIRFIRVTNVALGLCMASATLVIFHDWALPLVFATVALLMLTTIAYIIISYKRR